MEQALTATLRLLAKRWASLADELKTLDAMLERLTTEYAPRLRERFGIVQRLAFYTNEELTRIVRRSATILNID